MHFAKWPRSTAYVETSRKRANFVTKQRREREVLPLFADMIATGQQSVEEEMARRAQWWPPQQQQLRDERAAAWRRAAGQATCLRGHGRHVRLPQFLRQAAATSSARARICHGL